MASRLGAWIRAVASLRPVGALVFLCCSLHGDLSSSFSLVRNICFPGNESELSGPHYGARDWCVFQSLCGLRCVLRDNGLRKDDKSTIVEFS